MTNKKRYKYIKTFRMDGKKYFVYANTLEELYEKLVNKKRDIQEGKVILSPNTTVSNWALTCIDTYKQGISDKSRLDIIYRTKKHILSEIGSRSLRSITPIECQKIINNLSGYSYSQVKKVAQNLKFIFKMAVKNKLLLDNPAEFLEMPKLKKGKRRSLTDEERGHFYKVCNQDKRFMLFEIMLNCGCRPSEAINLKYDDISLIDDVYMLHIRGTKTENADRIVPIPDYLANKLINNKRCDYLCPNSALKKMDRSSYIRVTSSLKRALNISMGCEVYRNELIPPLPLAPDFVPYMFRHTYCSDLQKKGIDIRTAQKLMGHSSISITAEIYTHVDTKEIVKAGKILKGCTTSCTTTESIKKLKNAPI